MTALGGSRRGGSSSPTAGSRADAPGMSRGGRSLQWGLWHLHAIRPHTGLWVILKCACLAPPLRLPAPLPPPADHAQSDEGKQERRGFGDALCSADHSRYERIDVQTVDNLVLVHVGLGLVWAAE